MPKISATKIATARRLCCGRTSAGFLRYKWYRRARELSSNHVYADKRAVVSQPVDVTHSLSAHEISIKRKARFHILLAALDLAVSTHHMVRCSKIRTCGQTRISRLNLNQIKGCCLGAGRAETSLDRSARGCVKSGGYDLRHLLPTSLRGHFVTRWCPLRPRERSCACLRRGYLRGLLTIKGSRF